MASGTKAGRRRRGGRALDEVNIDLQELVPDFGYDCGIVGVLLLHAMPLRPSPSAVVHRQLDRLHPAACIDVAEHSAAVAQVGDPEAVLDAVQVHRAGAAASEQPGLARVLEALVLCSSFCEGSAVRRQRSGCTHDVGRVESSLRSSCR